MNKYYNEEVSSGGIVFDSKREQERWGELQLLLRAGKIANLSRQVRFELIPAQYESVERISPKTGKKLKDGKRCVEQSVVYIADFMYTDCESGKTVVEDAKGFRTEKYIIKRKLMLYKYGIKVKEV